MTVAKSRKGARSVAIDEDIGCRQKRVEFGAVVKCSKVEGQGVLTHVSVERVRLD